MSTELDEEIDRAGDRIWMAWQVLSLALGKEDGRHAELRRFNEQLYAMYWTLRKRKEEG